MSESAEVTDGDERPDDLEDEISLVITGRKHDVVEIANAIHAGHAIKSHQGELTPPDHAMLEELTEDLDDLLDFEGSTEALRARLETGDSDHLLTGNPVDVRLQDGDRDE